MPETEENNPQNTVTGERQLYINTSKEFGAPIWTCGMRPQP